MKREDRLEDNTHIFIIRIWLEPREIKGMVHEWRGMVEYVRTEERKYFRSLRSLIAFIQNKSELEDQ